MREIRDIEREIFIKSMCDSMCVCVCVQERGREREREVKSNVENPEQ